MTAFFLSNDIIKVVVSGLYINSFSATYQGLFGYNSGTIKNLTISSGSVTTTGEYDGMLTDTNAGTITNVKIVGGVTGYCTGNITSCSNSATVKVPDSTSGGEGYAGGISGSIKSGAISVIQNCYNTSQITSDDCGAAGILGAVSGDTTKVTIKNCYSVGTISGVQYAGKVLGYVNSSGTLTMENKFWLSGCGATNGNASAKNDNYCACYTSTQIKALASTLGSAYKADSSNTNSGYPILSWQ